MGNQITGKTVTILVLFWIVTAIVSGCIIGAMVWYPAWKLVQHRVITTAVVTRVDIQGGGKSGPTYRVDGTYTVDGKSYSIDEPDSYPPNPPTSMIHKGDTVTLNYDSTDPNQLTLGDARLQLRAYTNMWVAMSLGMPTFGVFIIFLALRVKQRRASMGAVQG